MSRKRAFRSKYVWMTVVLFVAAMAFGAYRLFTARADRPTYLFSTIQRGDIVRQVSATGTLQAVTTVQVGTQVSGTIADLYADFNSQVKKGQLLAKLDPALLQAQVDQQTANVNSAEATVNDAAAGLLSMRANLDKSSVDVLDKRRKLRRQQELFDEKLIPQDDLDTAQAALDASIATQKAAQAQLEASAAQLKADQARLMQAKASLDNARVNLAHTIITSPISGTIISRSVDRGQTVAASFSSPTLFTIAADLTKMQVSTDIDEADVGRIRAGMDASFNVDAYPGEEFHGKISQVRLAPTTIQNVVTYNAIIDVDNPRLQLKPGMTANVKILIDRADNVLKIPNAALRFHPAMTATELEQAYRRAGEERYYTFMSTSRGRSSGNRSTPSQTPMAASLLPAERQPAGERNVPPSGATHAERPRRVPLWVLGEDQLPRPVLVRLGLTDGVSTELVDGKLRQGDKVIIGLQNDPTRASSAASSRPPGFGGFGRGPR